MHERPISPRTLVDTTTRGSVLVSLSRILRGFVMDAGAEGGGGGEWNSAGTARRTGRTRRNRVPPTSRSKPVREADRENKDGRFGKINEDRTNVRDAGVGQENRLVRRAADGDVNDRAERASGFATPGRTGGRRPNEIIHKDSTPEGSNALAYRAYSWGRRVSVLPSPSRAVPKGCPRDRHVSTRARKRSVPSTPRYDLRSSREAPLPSN